MKSNSGEITRQKLLNIARENFYKKGFNKTTMQNISNELGIAIGSMAYYFKKKENIASTFLSDYLIKIYEEIDKHYKEPVHTFTRHAIASIPYYSNMLDDEKIKRFYYELLTGGSPHVSADPFKHQMNENNLRFMYESNVSYTNFYKKASNAYAISGRNELIKMLFKGEFNSVPIAYVINYVTEATGLILGLPRDVIKEALTEAIRFNGKHDLSAIRLL